MEYATKHTQGGRILGYFSDSLSHTRVPSGGCSIPSSMGYCSRQPQLVSKLERPLLFKNETTVIEVT